MAGADWNPTPGLVHVAEGGNSKMALVGNLLCKELTWRSLQRNTVMLHHCEKKRWKQLVFV